ncbi:MAG: flagellar filament capping protein FliD [Terriglobales bacterium]
MASPTSALSGITNPTTAGNFSASQYVQSIIASESAPEQQMQQQVSTLSTQATALGTISTQLNALQTAVFALNDFQGALNAQVATSSDTGVVTATAGSGATAGTHTVVVSNLATTSSQYSNTLTDGNTTFATGSVDIQVGSGTPTSLTVDSTDDTLSTLATAINNANAGVTASVITDASGSRLGLISNTSGASGQIAISNNTTGLTFTQAVGGANANFTLDGINLASASNAVTGVLQGVTLDLQGVSSAAGATVTIAPDTTQATTAIQSFVTAYNTVIQSLDTQFTYNPQTQSTGALGSDQTVMQLQQNLLGDAAFSISGNSGMTNLASIGIAMNEDGTLTIDNATLSASMASNYGAVQNLFQSVSPAGFAQNFSNDLLNLTDPSKGLVALDQQGIQQQTNDLNQQITDFQTNLNAQEAQLMQVYSQVAVTIQNMPTLLSQTQSELSSLG